ncbi:PBP1A family penicillin-binding protein [Apilactobacillus apisilvae]|uniref:PBP1A family penicillin-binding protein n=1 Tax=Apilactobacillus apisilvae TaxID=2923364 RepID=A0ABY4PIM0_9LACO|nr:PBP1A family penicillin-binding protein [Apilactobacillus apisilvae]UQS85363.1 PBP1A family penicillin-binding protein [Apilactobacillus apisilvae]
MSQNDSKNTRVRRNQNKYKKSKVGKIIKRTILGILALISLGVIAGSGVFAYYASSAPKITYNSLSSDNSTKIYDNSNHIISRLGAQNRDYVKSDQIPNKLKNAVVSIEDRRFYKHHGVDPIRILGATLSNLNASSGLQGGSTLTQQLVKLSVFSTAASDRTIKRKSQEAWLALQIERKYSKQKILEFYINKVYMGNNVYGMQTASEYYYGKTLNKLTLAQTAVLAGMPQSPKFNNPYIYPKLAKDRRNQVLQAMAESNTITEAQSQKAQKENIKNGLISSNHTQNDLTDVKEKYVDSYLNQVIQELKARGYNPQAGLTVHTNLDLSAQKKLYNLANNDPQVGFPNDTMQVGATLINPKTGAVNAMIGSRKTDITFGLNRAVQTDRSSGSTAKPLMDYGPALEYLNYPTYQTVHDTPYTYPGTNTQLKDFDYRYQGAITMHKALVESRNIPAIRTLQNVGIDNGTRFLASLGMKFKDPLNLQNGIGLYISPQQEAAAYGAFANNGVYHKPYLINKVVTSDNVSHNISSNGVQAMSPSTAFMMNSMLKGVMNLPYGSGTAAKVPGLIEAGKTGTTQYPEGTYQGYLPSYAVMDSWFAGYTTNYSLAIWTGYDHQFQTGNYMTAQQTEIAQKIYKYEMEYISRNKTNEDWVQPNDVSSVKSNGSTEYYKNGYQSIQTDSTSPSSSRSTTSTNNK